MSILDSESFESYFTTDADSSSSNSPCNVAKGRYDNCFFKSYSESLSFFLPIISYPANNTPNRVPKRRITQH